MPDVARERTIATWTSGPADPWPSGRNVRVMLAGLDPALQARYRWFLEPAGYGVETAGAGADLTEPIERHEPDLVLVGTAGGGDRAARLAQQLKASPGLSDIPLLLVLSDRDASEPDDVAEWVFDDCLTASDDVRELLLRVRSMVRLHRHRVELRKSRNLHGEQARMWQVLMDFARAVPGARDLGWLFDRIVATAAELTSSRRVSLMLPDERQEYLTIARSVGLDDHVAATARIPIGEAVAGEAYRTGRPVTTLDRHQELRDRDGYHFRSFVSMPMIYTPMSMVHQRVGVLNVADRYGDRAFEEWELEFIDLLAGIAASAIDDIHARSARESLLRIERDLQLAREIQRNTFPDRLPELPGFEIDAWSEPAEETAGDTYDIVGDAQSDGAFLLLADATGHGIGPALSVTQVRAMLRMALRMDDDLVRIAGHLNEQLCADLPGGRFVTAWLGRLDAGAGTISAVSAGQAPILHYDAASGRVERLAADTLPLGIMPSFDVAAARPLRLRRGDVLAVLSDGIFEAAGPAGGKFGVGRVIDVLTGHRGDSPRAMHLALARALDEFTEGAPADDDRTAIIIKRTGR